MNLRPLHDWVAIERDPVKTEENGFFIPSLPSNQGKVLAVGPYVQGIDVGDRVQFNPYAGLLITISEMSVTIVKPVDIVGIIGDILMDNKC